MEPKSQTKGALEAVTTRLAARWSGRDPFELANRATAQLMDSASGWSPPPGVEFKRSPVRLGVGIPDAVTLPCEEFAGGCLRFTPPWGGFYLWVELLEGLTADALWRAGAEEGVWFPAGPSFFPDRTDPTGEHIRLAFPWTSTEELREGARRIGLACQRLAREGAAR